MTAEIEGLGFIEIWVFFFPILYLCRSFFAFYGGVRLIPLCCLQSGFLYA